MKRWGKVNALVAAPLTRFSVPAGGPTVTHTSLDPRETRATPQLARFLVLVAQLALLQLVFIIYNTVETPHFLRLSLLTFGAFLVHYWLPFRFKEAFFAIVSIGGAFFLLLPRVAGLLILAGLVIFLILRSRIRYKWRVLSVAAIFAALIYSRLTGTLSIPLAFYPVFGALFMFRIIIYIYDLAHAQERPHLLPFLTYFFLLPNYLMTLFPVIDFQTMRLTQYKRNIHDIAQQGIYWMTRGTIQLMLYRLVVYFNDAYLPDRVTSLGALISTMILTYLLYLNVSGQFHLAVGMLHLFGYDLPETNRRYLLASSIMDFWRRINIYWKDFMTKIVYFPIYFRVRRKGEVRAQVMATAAVFLVTWASHSYQFFWIRHASATLVGSESGSNLTWPDAIFWGILGLLAIANVLYNARHKRMSSESPWRGRVAYGLRVIGTFTLITILWSLWSSPSVSAWIYLMTHWAKGR